MKGHRWLLAQNGNMLVEVMISALLLAVAAAGFAAISQVANKGQLGLRTSMEFQEAQVTSLMILTNQALCTTALQGKILDLTDSTDVVPSMRSLVINGETLVPHANRYSLNNFKIRIANLDELYVFSGTQKVYRSDVFVEADRAANAMGATQLQSQIPILLLIETGTAPQTIVSCYLEGVVTCPP
jgi:hypothetical protein